MDLSDFAIFESSETSLSNPKVFPIFPNKIILQARMHTLSKWVLHIKLNQGERPLSANNLPLLYCNKYWLANNRTLPKYDTPKFVWHDEFQFVYYIVFGFQVTWNSNNLISGGCYIFISDSTGFINANVKWTVDLLYSLTSVLYYIEILLFVLWPVINISKVSRCFACNIKQNGWHFAYGT